MKNMYGKQVRGIERSTFLIDAEGKLRQEWRGVKVKGTWTRSWKRSRH
jgi:peroxiredoxin Q/BCP